jgi:hypothetical protein
VYHAFGVSRIWRLTHLASHAFGVSRIWRLTHLAYHAFGVSPHLVYHRIWCITAFGVSPHLASHAFGMVRFGLSQYLHIWCPTQRTYGVSALWLHRAFGTSWCIMFEAFVGRSPTRALEAKVSTQQSKLNRKVTTLPKQFALQYRKRIGKRIGKTTQQ